MEVDIVVAGGACDTPARINLYWRSIVDTLPQNTPQKQCTTCKNAFPATPEFFYRSKPKKDGLASQCKRCQEKFNRSPAGKERKSAHNRVYGHVHRAHKRGLQDVGTHSEQQIQEQLKSQRCRCYYCQGKFERRYIYHVDHTFPISRASGDDPINDMGYLVLTCPTCNSKKGDKYPHEFSEGGKLL